MLLAATLFFSILTFLTSQAASLNQLLAVRFIAGVGLGGIMPNALALIGEYTPTRKRVASMIFVANGFNLGAALGGFFAAWLIPHFGWRSVFYFGGAVPLVIFLLMVVFLPESLQLMVMRGTDRRKITNAVKKLNPALPVDDNTEYVVKEERKGGVPAVHLFSNGRGTVTVMLWCRLFSEPSESLPAGKLAADARESVGICHFDGRSRWNDAPGGWNDRGIFVPCHHRARRADADANRWIWHRCTVHRRYWPVRRYDRTDVRGGVLRGLGNPWRPEWSQCPGRFLLSDVPSRDGYGVVSRNWAYRRYRRSAVCRRTDSVAACRNRNCSLPQRHSLCWKR